MPEKRTILIIAVAWLPWMLGALQNSPESIRVREISVVDSKGKTRITIKAEDGIYVRDSKGTLRAGISAAQSAIFVADSKAILRAGLSANEDGKIFVMDEEGESAILLDSTNNDNGLQIVQGKAAATISAYRDKKTGEDGATLELFDGKEVLRYNAFAFPSESGWSIRDEKGKRAKTEFVRK